MVLPSDVLPIIDDAEQAIARIADDQKRKNMAERLDQVRQGAFDVIVVRGRRKPVCFIAVDTMGEDTRLRFGHMLPAFEYESEAILGMSVKALVDRGFRSILSVFKWPEPEPFTRAAENAGFTRVDRMDMARKCEAGSIRHLLPEGIRMTPWSPRYSGAAASILFENHYPDDSVFHKPYRTREGCRAYLDHIINHQYGQFLPELSYVAHNADQPVGLLLSADLPQAGINIADLAVDRAFRGQGIASAMIGRLIEDGAAAAKGDIVLTVTCSNQKAFNLYQRLGFNETARVGYYVYVTDA